MHCAQSTPPTDITTGTTESRNDSQNTPPTHITTGTTGSINDPQRSRGGSDVQLLSVVSLTTVLAVCVIFLAVILFILYMKLKNKRSHSNTQL